MKSTIYRGDYPARYAGAVFESGSGNAGADLFHPQRWNAYTHVGNNPLVGTDPSGLCDPGDDGDPSTGLVNEDGSVTFYGGEDDAGDIVQWGALTF